MKWKVLGIMLTFLMVGCGGPTVGTERDARKFFDVEFRKWIAGEENQLATMMSKIQRHLSPISYDIRSVVPDKPDFLAKKEGSDLPSDWKEWPAFRFNVAIESKSEAGTPVSKVTTYTLTWNSQEKCWYVQERFL